jgi:hypothetical protein
MAFQNITPTPLLLHRFWCYADSKTGPPTPEEVTQTLIASRKNAPKRDKGIWLIVFQAEVKRAFL